MKLGDKIRRKTVINLSGVCHVCGEVMVKVLLKQEKQFIRNLVTANMENSEEVKVQPYQLLLAVNEGESIIWKDMENREIIASSGRGTAEACFFSVLYIYFFLNL